MNGQVFDTFRCIFSLGIKNPPLDDANPRSTTQNFSGRSILSPYSGEFASGLSPVTLKQQACISLTRFTTKPKPLASKTMTLPKTIVSLL